MKPVLAAAVVAVGVTACEGSKATPNAHASSLELFGGGSGRAVSESQKLTELRFAQCMRARGIKSFPDPISLREAGSSGPTRRA